MMHERQQQFEKEIIKLEQIYNKSVTDHALVIAHMKEEYDKSLMRVKDTYYANLKVATLDANSKKEEMIQKCNALLEQLQNTKKLFISNYKSK